MQPVWIKEKKNLSLFNGWTKESPRIADEQNETHHRVNGMIRPNSQYLSNPHPHKLIARMHNESVHDTNHRGCSNGHAGLVSMCWIYAKRKEQKFTLIRRAGGNEIDFGRLAVALTSAAWKRAGC